jgi:hypothetical protein
MSLPQARVSLIVILFLFYLPSHSFIHSPPHLVIGLLSMLLATIERHPSHVTLSPTNPFSEFAISWEYGPIDEELKHALARERLWSVAAWLLADQFPGDAVCVLLCSFYEVLFIDLF